MSRLSPVHGEIVELRRAGWTLQEIGDRFGCTREAIRLVCDKYGAQRGWTIYAYRNLAHAVRVAARCELRRQRGGSLSEHGTESRYDWGCRCEGCTAANYDRLKSLHGKDPPRHGTASAYFNYRCRCDRCKGAGSYYNALMRARRRTKAALSKG